MTKLQLPLGQSVLAKLHLYRGQSAAKLVSFVKPVIRPQDHLVLVFQFQDVHFVPPGPHSSGKVLGRPGARLAVYFPSQHMAEEAFFEQSGFGPLRGPPSKAVAEPGLVKARPAGVSRLAFNIPAGESIDYTVQGLLEALTRLPLRVAPVASYGTWSIGCVPVGALLRLLNFPPPPAIAVPGPFQTAIEVPYRLYLSPDPYGSWSHAALPVTHGDSTELWHSRLGNVRGEEVTLRAVWSPDYNLDTLMPESDPSFISSLTGPQRNELVHLTSNWQRNDFEPAPVHTEQMMLSSLGAWLKVQGDWQPPTGLSVEQWRHEAAMGRDNYVRVVTAGYLFPFGHRASLVTITERKFTDCPQGGTHGMVAYLYQRMFVIVREPQKSYAHRSIPFRTVTIKTQVTPDLYTPAEEGDAILPCPAYRTVFYPRIKSGEGAEDFQFQLEATDWQGRTIEFTAPLIYLEQKLDQPLAEELR